ncbi:hypothetical protein, partial [Acinetobacter pittii]|uniref:hypothetical protein n=1 Tax=Acinetobacter pittii TaxID=48296 RepID=UPI00227A46D4
KTIKRNKEGIRRRKNNNKMRKKGTKEKNDEGRRGNRRRSMEISGERIEGRISRGERRMK